MKEISSERWEIFRRKSYLLYFIGHTIAMLGTGMRFIAITWLIMELTGKGNSVGFILVFSALPGIILSPVIGIYVDRFDSKWMAVLMDVFRALVLVVIPLLWWFDMLQPWHLYLATFLIALGEEVYNPAAMILIREIIPQRLLLYSNSTNTIAMQAGALVGAGLGGVIISLSSPMVVMIINAFCFFFSAICILSIRKDKVIPARPTPSSGGFGQFFTELGDGIRYIRNHHNIIVFYSMMFFIRMSLYTINVLLAPFSKDELQVGAAGFGYIDACFAVGAVVGNFLLPRVVKFKGDSWTMTAGMFGIGVSILLFGFSTNLVSAMTIYFVLGMMFQVGVLYLTKAQEATDINLQGRVHATFNTFFSILSLGIYLGMSFLSEVYSFGILYTFQGIIIIFVGVFSIFAIYRKQKEDVNRVSL
ncbi:hypothetical protein AR454_21785 [Bacillus mycoides]|uniref:MFS transporter n=1 Tax=Bacillus mycoides TaxID=1405 RepID=UPI001E511819|nr:MFS transporter [Bacillus mycoides]MCD4644870.1 hypothetical protein [Bacillus mycoides]